MLTGERPTLMSSPVTSANMPWYDVCPRLEVMEAAYENLVPELLLYRVAPRALALAGKALCAGNPERAVPDCSNRTAASCP